MSQESVLSISKNSFFLQNYTSWAHLKLSIKAPYKLLLLIISHVMWRLVINLQQSLNAWSCCMYCWFRRTHSKQFSWQTVGFRLSCSFTEDSPGRQVFDLEVMQLLVLAVTRQGWVLHLVIQFFKRFLRLEVPTPYHSSVTVQPWLEKSNYG